MSSFLRISQSTLAQEKIRLDDLLIERGFALDRIFAQSLILSGSVLVNDHVETKSGFQYPKNVNIRIKEKIKNYVSRGAYKLLGAIDDFSKFPIESQFCIDLGSSTGGFTQVLLEKGARHVLAVDVGYGQLEERVRNNPKVIILDRFHFKNLEWENIYPNSESNPNIIINPKLESVSVTADLSFISIEKVFQKLIELYNTDKTIQIHSLLLVKPQFELDADFLEKGIVKDKRISIQILTNLIRKAIKLYQATFHGISKSKILGTEGNQEYFIYLTWGI